MMRQQLITCFEDTVRLSQEGPLKEQTANAAASSAVYRENFVSSRLYAVSDPVIRVVEGTSFAVAKENLRFGRVAVLNFANPHYPGGGVRRGAMAQEECLCRSSNLYACLSSEQVFEDYYKFNREQTDHFFSDRLIYTKNVTVFKDDSPVPRLMTPEDWFQVDVITCAAPYLEKRRYTNSAALEELLQKRIRNMLEAAIENEAEVLILGAFGCGAFKNPPEVVARAFRRVLGERRYHSAFKRIIFAIKSSVDGDPYTVCPNIAAFQLEFFGVSSELEKLRYIGGLQKDPGAEDMRMPGGRIQCRGSESKAYQAWKQRNPYFGRQFSILGDSISTLEGFNPRGYHVFYQGETCEKTGVRELADTWWGKVIDFFGGELLVNDAWSGSWVSRPEARKEQFPSGCSDRRTGELHIGSVMPDVILVQMGVNDWGNGVAIDPERELGMHNADTFFSLAYGLMLRKLRKNYPNAEIWCCTLGQTYISENPEFKFPEAYGGISIREYNHCIVNGALANDCRVLDLYGEDVPCDTVDGTHPNAAGMDTLAMLAVRQMADPEGVNFLACQRDHDVVNGVCRRCGLRIGEANPRKNPLRLRLQSTGDTVEFTREYITVGRNPECDLHLNNGYVARNQAVFVRRGGTWYVRDAGTKNGTYLNDVWLEPGREYPLKRNDVISFARKESVVIRS